jgi:chromosome partitioning protein
MKTIAFVIQKGGAGKTTLAYNIAHALARHGRRVLALDLDPQGSMSKGFIQPDKQTCFAADLFDLSKQLVEPQAVRENVWLVAANRHLAAVERSTTADTFFMIKERMATVRDHFDYAIIDTPPSLGILPSCAMIASDYVVIPIEPEPQAIDGMMEVHSTIANVRRRMQPTLGILGHILNNVNWSRALSKETHAGLKSTLGERLFSATVGTNVKIAEAWSHHKTIWEYDPEGKGALELGEVTKEFMRRTKDALEQGQGKALSA